MSVLLLLQPIILWNWYFKVDVINSKPVYVFYDKNSKIVYYLSKNPGGVDDFSYDKSVIAIAWWDVDKRKRCYVSFIGKDLREFKRVKLGECGNARMGVDVNGLDFVVIYSKPYLSDEGCVVEGWKDFKVFYRKHVGKCLGGDVFLKNGKIEYAKVVSGKIETSWDGCMKCDKIIYGGGWIGCDEKRLSP